MAKYYGSTHLSKEDWADINSQSDRTQWDYADLTEWQDKLNERE